MRRNTVYHHRNLQKHLTFSAVSVLALCSGCSLFHRSDAATYQDAVEAVAHNDYRKANTILTKATDAHSEDPKILILAGKVALEQGDAQRASLIFQGLHNSQKAGLAREVAPLLAKSQVALGKPADALKTLGPEAGNDPLAAAVDVSALSQTGEIAKALTALDQGLKKFPQSIDLLVLDGVRDEAMGRFAQADTVALQLRKLGPDKIEALIFEGQLAMAENRVADARKMFQHAHDVRPDHRMPMLALAKIARISGDRAAENTWIGKALKVDGGDPAVAVYAAELALEAKHADQAARILAPYQYAANNSLAMQLVIGLTNAETNHSETAIADLESFISHGGEDGRARMALAVLLSRKGDNVQAWKVLKPLANAANAGLAPLRLAVALCAATNDPAKAGYAARADALAKGDPDTKDMTAASAAISAGEWQKADAIYTRLLANPRTNQVVLLNNAAFTKIQLGDGAASVQLARRAAALAPNDPVVMDTLGWSLFKSSGATPEAVGLLQNAMSLQPGDASIRQHVAQARRARSR